MGPALQRVFALKRVLRGPAGSLTSAYRVVKNNFEKAESDSERGSAKAEPIENWLSQSDRRDFPGRVKPAGGID